MYCYQSNRFAKKTRGKWVVMSYFWKKASKDKIIQCIFFCWKSIWKRQWLSIWATTGSSRAASSRVCYNYFEVGTLHSHTCWRLEVCSMMPNSLARSPKSSGPQSISQSVQPVGIAWRGAEAAAAVTVARGSGIQQRRRRRHPGPESRIQWCTPKSCWSKKDFKR